MKTRMIGTVSTSFQYYSSHKYLKPYIRLSEKPVLSEFCESCTLPRKAPYNSPRNLTRFESKYFKNTLAAKAHFTAEIKQAFCNPETCDTHTIETQKTEKWYKFMLELAEQDLGPHYTKTAYRKWRKRQI